MRISLLLVLLLVPLMVFAEHIPGHDTIANPQNVDHVNRVDRVGVVESLEIPTMFVGATEYVPFDEGKVFVQLINGTGSVVNNASCLVRSWYPNSTVFFPKTLMMFLDDGIYYYDFLLPNVTGVYPVAVECDFLTVTEIVQADSFVRVPGTAGGGGLPDLEFVDGNFLKFDEKGASNRATGGNITFPVSNSTPLAQVSINLFVSWEIGGGDPVSDRVRYGFLNFSSGEVVYFGNHDYTIGVQEFTFTILDESAINDFFNGTHFLLNINDTFIEPIDTHDTHYHLDYLRLLSTNVLTTNVEHIRGGGELHVSRGGQIIISLPDQELGINFNNILFILWIILVIACLFVDEIFLHGLTGIYSVIFGFTLLGTVGFWLAMIVWAIGLGCSARILFTKE